MTLFFRMNGVSVFTLLEARSILFPPVAGLAAMRADAAGIATLRSLLLALEAGHAEDMFDAASMQGLYLTVARLSGNELLEASMRPMIDLVGVQFQTWWTRDLNRALPRIIGQWGGLIEAIEARDQLAAQRKMEEIMNFASAGLRGHMDIREDVGRRGKIQP